MSEGTLVLRTTREILTVLPSGQSTLSVIGAHETLSLGLVASPGAAGADGADGATGPEGPPGQAGGGATSYNHSQMIASASWVINHGLGRFASVTVRDSTEEVVVGDVTHLSANSLTVTFSAPFGGTAYLI